MSRAVRKLSLAEFLELPESCDCTELVDGEIIPKVSPKYKHASVHIYSFFMGTVIKGINYMSNAC